MEMKKLCFVTGNAHKVEEFSAIAKKYGFEFVAQKLDVPELQGTPEEVAIAKCRAACKIYNGPVLTEDVSFIVNAWNGLPGVYIKDFLTSVGPEGFVKMLEGFEDKSAVA